MGVDPLAAFVCCAPQWVQLSGYLAKPWNNNLMNLDDFVANSLASVTRGVASAIKESRSHGAAVNPRGAKYPDSRGSNYGHTNADRTPRMIEFDVAITVSEGSSEAAGGGGNIKILSANMQSSTQSGSSTVSRLRFSVPVILPSDPDFAADPDEE